VLVPRETPLNAIQIRNMLTLTGAGATILPAAPGFYHRPKDIGELIDHIVGKTLDVFHIEHHLYSRWKDEPLS
jgi:4-hydroxy-3-polyprenylbenzoate decarboxylase